MHLRTEYNQQQTPHIEGDILLYNYYDCEVTVTPSGIRSLQTGSRNVETVWKDFQSYIVPHYADTYSPQYAIRCSHDTLRKAVKLARLGFDIDLRPYSGKNATPLKDIKPLLKALPEKSLPKIFAYLAKSGSHIKTEIQQEETAPEATIKKRLIKNWW